MTGQKSYLSFRYCLIVGIIAGAFLALGWGIGLKQKAHRPQNWRAEMTDPPEHSKEALQSPQDDFQRVPDTFIPPLDEFNRGVRERRDQVVMILESGMLDNLHILHYIELVDLMYKYIDLDGTEADVDRVVELMEMSEKKETDGAETK